MNWTTTASDSPSTMAMDSSPAPNDNYGSGGSGTKVRKPYTITKSRKSWTGDEHEKFLEALHLFDRDWKKIENFVGSKSVIQIRSHAQKYFMKVEKNGTIAHVPPPRPKRKSAHPYPQKAPKNVVAPVQASRAYPSSVNDPTVGIFPIQDDYNLHGAQGLRDLGEVYSFIGNMFDPESQGHEEKLKEMDLINFEAVILLMRNLTINLCDPDCASLC